MKRHFNAITRPAITRSLLIAMKAAGAASVVNLAGAAGCLSRPVETLEPKTTSTIFERLSRDSVNKIDILLAIDNSSSMADKQEILALAVPDLVKGLANPRCVGPNGAPLGETPTNPELPCPDPGARREFKAITDIHVGIISSSLGGHGSDACRDAVTDTNACPDGATNTSNNDKGRLLSRRDPCAKDAVPTYSGKGFLAWDPKQARVPAGEPDLDADADGDGRALVPDLTDMVKGVGQVGCGFEAQLESWYRFLVDPEPYATISVAKGLATPQGRDDALLAERANFLRPDSLVAIVLLSDENDCSIKESGPYFWAAQLKDPNNPLHAYHLPRARSECATDPNDPCCLSCGQGQGSCPPDPTCYGPNGEVLMMDAADDPADLRCVDQKRRFGVDFLYSIDRYAKALKGEPVPNRAGDLVPNPLFERADPEGNHAQRRAADRVFFAGIVGVPWQGVARDPKDLSKGLKTSAELKAELPSGGTTWDILLGDPAKQTPPSDPHMIESTSPRTGFSPITGASMVAPGNPLSDPIHGSERLIPNRDDLQYACTFKLPTPRDCNDPSNLKCDCRDESDASVLCEDTPESAGDQMLQVRAKAYPGLRELSLLRDIEEQGIVASVCPSQMDAPEQADFGYRPAIGAIVDRLKEKIHGQCLPRSLTPDKKGKAPCMILEARRVDEGSAAACNACEGSGRSPASAFPAMINSAKEDNGYEAEAWNCFCMIDQADGADKEACQNDTSPSPINTSTGEEASGWCYVDATTVPATGNPELVATCAENEKRIVRFVGDAGEKPSSTLFIYCDSSASD